MLPVLMEHCALVNSMPTQISWTEFSRNTQVHKQNKLYFVVVGELCPKGENIRFGTVHANISLKGTKGNAATMQPPIEQVMIIWFNEIQRKHKHEFRDN